jgi:hypothetical protein
VLLLCYATRLHFEGGGAVSYLWGPRLVGGTQGKEWCDTPARAGLFVAMVWGTDSTVLLDVDWARLRGA